MSEASVSYSLKFNNMPNKERIITAIKLGTLCVNQYLYKMNKHHTGHCAHCENTPDTTQHFILQCPQYNISPTFPTKNIRDILSNYHLCAELYTNTLNQHEVWVAVSKYLPAAPGFKLRGEAKGLSTRHSTLLAQHQPHFCFRPKYKIQRKYKYTKQNIKIQKQNQSRASCAHLNVSIANMGATCTR